MPLKLPSEFQRDLPWPIIRANCPQPHSLQFIWSQLGEYSGFGKFLLTDTGEGSDQQDPELQTFKTHDSIKNTWHFIAGIFRQNRLLFSITVHISFPPLSGCNRHHSVGLHPWVALSLTAWLIQTYCLTTKQLLKDLDHSPPVILLPVPILVLKAQQVLNRHLQNKLTNVNINFLISGQ